MLTAAPAIPLMWRAFDLPAGGESQAIRAAAASLGSLGRFCGQEGDVDAVLIHGRPDLGPLADVAEAEALPGVKVLRHDAPGLDEGVDRRGPGRGAGAGRRGVQPRPLARPRAVDPRHLPVGPGRRSSVSSSWPPRSSPATGSPRPAPRPAPRTRTTPATPGPPRSRPRSSRRRRRTSSRGPRRSGPSSRPGSSGRPTPATWPRGSGRRSC